MEYYVENQFQRILHLSFLELHQNRQIHKNYSQTDKKRFIFPKNSSEKNYLYY